jgi:hypothetical protein
MRFRPKRVPEKVVQQQIVNMLRSVGAAVYVLGTKRPSTDFQGTRQSPGIPDLFVFLPAPRLQPGAPAALWIEVKAAGGTLRREQDEFRTQCRLVPTLGYVTGGVDQVISYLVNGGWLKSENVPHYRLPGSALEARG